MSLTPTSYQQSLLDEFPFLRYVEAEPDGFIGRGSASQVLGAVAELGSSGNYPHDIPLEAVGAALYRICINAEPSEVGLSKIVLGWEVAKAYHNSG